MASDREGSSDAADLAFESAFEQHFGSILAFASRRLPDRQEAEEVAAETFAVAWRRRTELDTSSLPWLYAVAGNLVSNLRRSTRRSTRLRARLMGERSRDGRDPAEALSQRSVIASAFGELSEEQREVLRLAFWEELAPADAAVALGCSKGAYEVRLHRARKALAKELETAGHEAERAEPDLPAKRQEDAAR